MSKHVRLPVRAINKDKECMMGDNSKDTSGGDEHRRLSLSDDEAGTVKDYAGARSDEEHQANKKTLVIGGGVLLALAAVAAVITATLVNTLTSDGEDNQATSIAVPATVTSSPTDGGQSTMGARQSLESETSRTTTPPSVPAEPAQPVTADDVGLPATQIGDWSQVVNPRDRITQNTEMVDHIHQLLDAARVELTGVEVDPSNPDPRLQDVTNFYFYGNQQATMGMADLAAGVYTETGNSLTVYDTARDGIYTFTYNLASTQGGNGFLMAGWYDPVTDSLKIHTASQTR